MNKFNRKVINFKDIPKFKHPWEIKNDFLIFKKAEKDYQKYLFFLTEKLNNHFNKNFSTKFWEIILGLSLFKLERFKELPQITFFLN